MIGIALSLFSPCILTYFIALSFYFLTVNLDCAGFQLSKLLRVVVAVFFRIFCHETSSVSQRKCISQLLSVFVTRYRGQTKMLTF